LQKAKRQKNELVDNICDGTGHENIVVIPRKLNEGVKDEDL
jgi:hypothetical protein